MTTSVTTSRRSAEGRFLQVDGLRTHVLTAGAGAPLVLLHGSALDSGRLTYGGSLAALAAHYQVIAPDWPGYGRSEEPEEGATTEFYIDFLASLVDALGLDAFYLGGFSMGGGVALGYALAHPERVRKLVLIDAYGLDGRIQIPFLPYLALRTPQLSRLTWAALRRSPRALRLFLRILAFRQRKAVTEEVLEEVIKQLRIPNTERAFMGWLRGELRLTALTTNYLGRLETLTPPTLLIHGDRDLVVPVSRAKRAAKRIPDATLKILPAGHWTPREAREAFNEAMLEFLAS